MKTYYENKYGVLYHGDCFDIMKELGMKFDLVLTDPPYNTTSCEWDKKSINLNILKNELIKLTNKYSSMIFFGNEPFSTHLRNVFIDLYKYDFVWIKNKPTCFCHAKNMPMRRFENIMIFSKCSMGHLSLLGEKRMVYNPQGLVKAEIKHKGAKRKYGGTVGARPSNKDEYVQEFTNYPDNVLYYDKDGNEHPTQKPVKLLEYLCLTYSKKNDLVLDPFAGSGSTGVACIKTNRQFVLIEKNERFCEITAKRLEEALQKSSLLNLCL